MSFTATYYDFQEETMEIIMFHAFGGLSLDIPLTKSGLSYLGIEGDYSRNLVGNSNVKTSEAYFGSASINFAF